MFRRTPKLKVNNLVKILDKSSDILGGDTLFWFHKFYIFKEFITDKPPKYRIHIVPERNDEALLKNTTITTNENKNVLKIFCLLHRLL